MVTIGTDGVVDYVQMPNGERLMLGSVSVLTLISNLVSPPRVARQAVDSFLQSNETLVRVDLDKMMDLLPFKWARFSSINPLMGKGDHTALETDMLKQASFDSFTSNVETAENIVSKVAATNSTIDRLVKAGKNFDSARAKSDLLKIASRVAEISENVDLAQPWVGNDLAELHKQATEIYALFPVED